MKAAFLSGSLISSKGSATPATRSKAASELLAAHKRQHLPQETSERPVQAHVEREVQMTPPKVSARPVAQASEPEITVRQPIRQKPTVDSADKYKAEQKKLKKDKLGRVRMSVRLAPDDHLTLKLLSTHARKSSQFILEEALREYVENHGDEILPQTCNCLLKQISNK